MARARPHICLSRKALGQTVQATGLHYSCVVYVKTGCRQFRKDFAYMVNKWGIVVETDEEGYFVPVDNPPVSRVGVDLEDNERFYPENYLSAFECVGTAAALKYLTGHPCVTRWHYVESTPVPFGKDGFGRGNPGECSADDADRAKRRAQANRRERANLAASVSPYACHHVGARGRVNAPELPQIEKETAPVRTVRTNRPDHDAHIAAYLRDRERRFRAAGDALPAAVKDDSPSAWVAR
jgi:hypothetical protein